jgi:predicted ATPase/tetratricopeptide (TPR) repeat protein/DNA-binding XRE family transcriptional regulator
MNTSFSDWLKQRRKALDLTQEELAWQVSCSAILLRKLEAGERRPSKQMAERLAEVLKISADERTAFIELARQRQTQEAQSHLPMPVPAFIGREQELTQIANALAHPAHRLLTIVGAGGMGKTYLALRAAESNASAFKDRNYFVGLVGVTSIEFIALAIANSIGFPLIGNAPPEEQLLDYLRDKNFLLLLDNFEHLLDGRNLIIKLLECAPLVKLLVTSRERLSLQHEWLLEIEGLAFDTGTAKVDDAPQLFLQRASRNNHTIEAQEMPDVLEICRLLDGMPLGIELAASWLYVLSCREIAAQIRSNAEFLTTDAIDVEERHQSLQHVFDHSWALLAPETQGILKSLSVFHSGFQHEAARAVTGATVRNLADLRNKSLISRDKNGRFQIHELLRQYISHKLTDEENYQVNYAHARYYAGFLTQMTPQLMSRVRGDHVKALLAEIENIRLAWRWSAETNELTFLNGMHDTLWVAFLALGWSHEGKATFAYACSKLKGSDDTVVQTYALMLGMQSWFEWHLGHLENAVEQGLEVLACFQKSGVTVGQGLVVCNNHLAFFLHSVGRYEEAKIYVQNALALARQIGQPFYIAAALYNLGRISYSMAEYTSSKAAIDEAALIQALGGESGEPYVLEMLGRIEIAQGNYETANVHLRTSLKIFITNGDQRGIAFPLLSLGRLARLRRDYAEAQHWFGEGARLTYKLQLMSDLMAIIVESAYLLSQMQQEMNPASWLVFALNHPATWQEGRDYAKRYLAELQYSFSPPAITLEAIMEVVQQWGSPTTGTEFGSMMTKPSSD